MQDNNLCMHILVILDNGVASASLYIKYSFEFIAEV